MNRDERDRNCGKVSKRLILARGNGDEVSVELLKKNIDDLLDAFNEAQRRVDSGVAPVLA